jgi:hypothetical protein
LANRSPIQTPARTADPENDFETWWALYPRKVGKGQARRAWTKAIAGTTVDVLIAGAERYAELRSTEDPEFTKHPATWLNGECWLDENAVKANGRGNGHDEHRDFHQVISDQAEAYCAVLRDNGIWHVEWGAKPDFTKPPEAQDPQVRIPKFILVKFCKPAVEPPA